MTCEVDSDREERVLLTNPQFLVAKFEFFKEFFGCQGISSIGWIGGIQGFVLFRDGVIGYENILGVYIGVRALSRI